MIRCLMTRYLISSALTLTFATTRAVLHNDVPKNNPREYLKYLSILHSKPGGPHGEVDDDLVLRGNTTEDFVNRFGG